MNAVDTNVLVYALDRADPVKRNKARQLLRHFRKSPTPTLLMWQVGGEFLRYLRSWQDQKKITRANAERYFNSVRRLFPLAIPTAAVFDRAIDLAARFSLSHWDSMILAACLEASVTTFFTEDMGSPTKFDTLNLVNPFV